MMTTLIVQYLPRGERSHTRVLLDAFIAAAGDQTFQNIDLCRHTPDMFVQDNLLAYLKRNYLGQALTPIEDALLAKSDELRDHLLQADYLVLATPMHNFGVPAVVKAWLDAVIQKGCTFRVDDHGYHGMLKTKAAAVLYASGGIYEGERATLDLLGAQTKLNFGLMGIQDVTLVNAGGMNIPDGKADDRQAAAATQAQAIARCWYGNKQPTVQ